MNMTDYGVFIVESLSLKDEKSKRLDGYILKQILDLCKIKNQYFYIRTEVELRKIIEKFNESKLRYLHLSCHGSSNMIHLTFDPLFFDDLTDIIGPYIKNRRVFLSACNSTNIALAKELIIHCQCYSVIGSPKKIGFDQSAVFWSGFYQRMNEIDSDSMKQSNMLALIEKLSTAFELPINYYSFKRLENKDFDKTKIKEYLIRPNSPTKPKVIPVG